MNAIIHVPFLATGEARIGNRLYRWDFDDYCGPTFVRSGGEGVMSDDRISKERDAIKATIAYMDARIGAVTRLLDAEREEVASRNNDVAEREVKLARVEKERDALKAKLEHADTRIRRLETCVEDFLELTEVPDANCSCHLGPPCGDCVEYGGIRDVRKTANELLKEGE